MLDGTDLGLITGLINAKGGGGGGGGVTPAEVRVIAREEAQSAAENKVDKVAGKGLSTEDYTTSEKTKLDGIANGAEVNVQSDWNQTDGTSDDFIKNKPQNLVQDANYVHTDNNYTTAEKEKLAELENYDDTEIREDIEEISGDVEGAKTVDGSVVAVDDAAPINAQSVVVDIEPAQDLHGYDHPWVGGAGKSQVNFDLQSGNRKGISFVRNSDGSFTFNGQPSETIDIRFLSELRVLMPDGNYIASGSGLPNESYTAYIELTNITSGTARYVRMGLGDTSFTATNELVSMFVRFASGQTVTNYTVKPMIRLASETDPTFEPYENICPISGWDECKITRNAIDEYTINFGETVYGGTLDVTKGELVVDRAIVDLGSLNWEYQSTLQVFNSTDDIGEKRISGITCVSSCYKAVNNINSATQMTEDFAICLYAGGYGSEYHRVYVKDTRYADVTEFKSAVTGQTLVYELETPYTIKLTPQQIKLLENTNTLYANCGDTTLKYQPNNALGKALEVAEIGYDAQIEYIKNNYLPTSEIAPVENGDTASTSYAVDDYLCRGNKLYKVISAIAQGATFTDNNIQKTTVMAEILSRL